MNRKKKAKSGTKYIYTVICLIVLAILATVVYGGTSILNPGTSRIMAGSSFDFTLNTGSLDTGDSEAEEAVNEYVVNLTVSPSAALTVKEGVGTVNAVTGSYQVTSSELGDISVLHFTVTPAGDIKTDTTYKVSVNVTGSAEASDSFSFVATVNENADRKEQEDDSKKQGDMPAGQKGSESKSGKPGSGRGSGKGGGTMSSSRGSAAGGGSSSDASSVTYAGSWNNYLDDLSVSGYDFTSTFNTTRDTYFISIPEDVTEVQVTAVPSDSSAIVAVTGTSDIPEGLSKIMISVTADDGSVRIYRIYVDRG